MQKKAIKKRRKLRKGFGRILIITIISLYFLSRVFPMLGTNSQKTIVSEFGKIENVISVTAYIARDEKVFTSTGLGEVKYFVVEGEKVAKNQKLAEVYLENLDEKYIQDLEIINHRIETIQSRQDEKPLFERDINKINNETNTILQKIQRDIQQGDYSNITSYKKNLYELADKQNIISGEGSFIGKSLSQLEGEKATIEAKIKTSLQTIKSDYPGFIAFGQDGLENVLNLASIEAIKVEDLDTIKKNTDKNPQLKSEDTSVLRIINSHRWSMVIEVDSDKIKELQIGKKLIVRKIGEDREYSSQIRKIITDDKKSLLILDLTEFIEGFYQTRTMEIDIIMERHEGVMIPNKAIVGEEDQKGVFRLDVNGFVRFVPVKPKGGNREYTILHHGTFDQVNKDTKETVRVNTIRLYDEIVLDASKVSEGQRVR